LERIDMIQVYRGGLGVLRIVLKKNNIGRSAYVEINDYKRKFVFFFVFFFLFLFLFLFLSKPVLN